MTKFISSNKILTLWNVRLSYPHLWETTYVMMDGKPTGDPHYSVQVVLDPNREDHAELIRNILQAERAIVSQSWPGADLRNLPPNFRRPIKKIDDPENELHGMVTLSAKARQDSPPGIVVRNADGKMVPTRRRDLIYPGCEAHVNLSLFSYRKSQANLGISAGLNHVWPTGRDVDRLDGRVTAKQAFADAPEDAQVSMDDEPFGNTGPENDPGLSPDSPGVPSDDSDPSAGIW